MKRPCILLATQFRLYCTKRALVKGKGLVNTSFHISVQFQTEVFGNCALQTIRLEMDESGPLGLISSGLREGSGEDAGRVSRRALALGRAKLLSISF